VRQYGSAAWYLSARNYTVAVEDVSLVVTAIGNTGPDSQYDFTL
jgi:hypothetical protein